MKLSFIAINLALCSCPLVAAFVPSSSTVRSSSRLAAGDLWEPEPIKKPEMSQALPFIQRPKMLDGTLAGDVGFDPFGFGGGDKPSLLNMREAEIKHSRLAMLAVVGWPLAELFDKDIANLAGLPAALTKSGESPSVLNGGLDRIDTLYWVAVVALAGIVEIENQKVKENKGKAYSPGDCSFDPLGLYPKDSKSQFEMQTKEIKHGRLAMMAILGFVVQEALYGVPVVQQTPFFFSPPSFF